MEQPTTEQNTHLTPLDNTEGEEGDGYDSRRCTEGMDEHYLKNAHLRSSKAALLGTFVSETVIDKGCFSQGSIRATIFTLLIATLGVGMLSIPRAFERSGLILTIIVVYLGAIVSYLSMRCLVAASSKTKLVSMSDLALWSHGMKFKYFTDFVFLINNFGTCVAYTIVIKENMAAICRSMYDLGWIEFPVMMRDQKSALWIIVSQCLLIPLVIKEKLAELRVFALISFGIISYIGLTIITNCFTNTYTKSFDTKWNSIKMFDISGLVHTVPVVIFGFTCQQNVLSCFRELQNPTLRRMDKVMARQMLLVSTIYILVGVYGYLTFGTDFSDQDQNILTKYDSKNISVLIGTFLLIISIINAQPFNVMPTREALFMFFRPGEIPTGWMNILVTMIAHVGQSSLAAISIINDVSLDKMLDYVSGATSATMCFIIPFVIYYKLIQDDPKRTCERYFYLVLIVLFSIFQIGKIMSFFL